GSQPYQAHTRPVRAHAVHPLEVGPSSPRPADAGPGGPSAHVRSAGSHTWSVRPATRSIGNTPDPAGAQADPSAHARAIRARVPARPVSRIRVTPAPGRSRA